MEKRKTNERGITLISLVITIIILLILATVAITLAVDSDGLFGKAGQAANTWNTSVATEENELQNLLDMADKLTPKEEEITFSIGTIEYTVVKGTTWRQWAEANNLRLIKQSEETTLIAPPSGVGGDYISTVAGSHYGSGCVSIDSPIEAGTYYGCTMVE